MLLSDDRELALKLWERTTREHPTGVRIPVADMIPIAAALLREVGRFSTSAKLFIAKSASILAEEKLVDLPAGRGKWDGSYEPP